MSGFFNRNGLVWYLRSDVELRTRTVWDIDGVERIDGFYFMTKRPRSKYYQWHGTIGLENTYKILSLIQKTKKERKKAMMIQMRSGIGTETILIWKGSLKKAEEKMFEMIKEIQKQY